MAGILLAMARWMVESSNFNVTPHAAEANDVKAHIVGQYSEI